MRTCPSGRSHAPHGPEHAQPAAGAAELDVDGMLNLDFDEQGRLIGIEVLAASSKLPEYLLQSAERLDTEGA
ncbi:DUF2283 domain-containing protein [Streptomyces sp. NPDC002666]